jgi:ribosomal protein L7/L12
MDYKTALWILAGLFLALPVLVRLMRMIRGDEDGIARLKGTPATIEDVMRLAAAGRKIEAIKVYRALHPVSLVEAKDAVEKLIGGHGTSPKNPNPTALLHSLDDVRRMAAAGQKIQAIKLYREITGAGLKEAKDAVESGAYQHPPHSESAEPSIMESVRQAVREGNLILAIKLYRQLNPHTGLAEAKDVVERIQRGEAPP